MTMKKNYLDGVLQARIPVSQDALGLHIAKAWKPQVAGSGEQNRDAGADEKGYCGHGQNQDQSSLRGSQGLWQDTSHRRLKSHQIFWQMPRYKQNGFTWA